jgi:hypothetical protein
MCHVHDARFHNASLYRTKSWFTRRFIDCDNNSFTSKILSHTARDVLITIAGPFHTLAYQFPRPWTPVANARATHCQPTMARPRGSNWWYVSSSSHAFFPSMERDSAMRAKARRRGGCVGVLAVVLKVVVREDKSATVRAA